MPVRGESAGTYPAVDRGPVDLDQLSDTYTPAGPFSITVSLPEGATPNAVVLFEFEDAKETELEFTVQDGKAALTIPSLYAYSVLEVR